MGDDLRLRATVRAAKVMRGAVVPSVNDRRKVDLHKARREGWDWAIGLNLSVVIASMLKLIIYSIQET